MSGRIEVKQASLNSDS